MDSNSKTIKNITIIELFINILLSFLKITFGVISASKSLLNDGFNSLGDVLTSFVAVITGKEANKKADKDHQFGHKKIENLVSLIFGMIIAFTSFTLLYEGIVSIINKVYLKEEYNLLPALIICVIALLIKLIMFIFTYIYSKKTLSPLLKTQSIDHLLDSISTFISFISLLIIFIFSNNINLRILDSISSLVIALIMLLGSIKIIYINSLSLLDKSCNKKEENRIREIILSNTNIYHIDALRSRLVGNYVFLEIEVTIKENLSLIEAHNIIEEIQNNILKECNNVKHCIIHINPLIHEEIDVL